MLRQDTIKSTRTRVWVATPTRLRELNWPATFGCLGISFVLVAGAFATWSGATVVLLFAGYLTFGLVGRSLYRAWKGNVLGLSLDHSEIRWGWSKTEDSQRRVLLSDIAEVNVDWGDSESWPSIEIVTKSGSYWQIPKAFTVHHAADIVDELKRRQVNVKESPSQE